MSVLIGSAAVVVTAVASSWAVRPGGPSAGATARFAVSPVTVIATGLDNPRGMVLKGNNLYVAEAGLGAGSTGGGAAVGTGATGAISIVRKVWSATPTQAKVVSGLSSYTYSEGGLQTIGIDSVALDRSGTGFALLGLFGEPGTAGTTLGNLVRYPTRGSSSTVATVGAVDYAWTSAHAGDSWAPVNQFPDANPYGLVTIPGHTYTIDAGANTLDEVLADGTVHVLAFIPNTPTSDAVPTCVTKGPDGALYIGTLALKDWVVHGPGTATVYRVAPSATDPTNLSTVLNVATVWATGLSTISGCTFSPAGNFYATEMFANDVVKVPFATPTTGRKVYGAGTLSQPDGVAVDSKGDVYVSDRTSSASAGAGRVVRFAP